MHRRDFLVSAAAAAGLAATGRGWSQGRPQQANLNRIAIMTYSFDNVLKKPSDPTGERRVLDINDLPQMYADRFGVHNIELQHSHLWSTEPAYLRDYRARVERVGSKISQINLELGTHNISSPNLVTRLETIDLTKQWIEHAVILGCPRVMINQGNLAPEVRATAAETWRTMARYGDTRNVWVTAENRGQTWDILAEVVKAAGAYTTPDIGNVTDQPTQHAMIRGLFPYNRGNAHVKLRPDRYDLPAAIRLTKEVGYTGLFSIEANPGPHDPYEAVMTMRDVILSAL